MKWILPSQLQNVLRFRLKMPDSSKKHPVVQSAKGLWLQISNKIRSTNDPEMMIQTALTGIAASTWSKQSTDPSVFHR